MNKSVIQSCFVGHTVRRIRKLHLLNLLIELKDIMDFLYLLRNN
jgi:hypothetical protein